MSAFQFVSPHVFRAFKALYEASDSVKYGLWKR